MRRSLVVVCLILADCISPYHVGGNMHNDGTVLFRPVPKSVADDLVAFEEECVKAIRDADADRLMELASPHLRDRLAMDNLRSQLASLHEAFRPAGGFVRQDLNGNNICFDEQISQDPYEIYDFIASEYEIVGQPSFRVLLLSKKNPRPELWGFSIHPAEREAKTSHLTYFSADIRGWWTFGVAPFYWWTRADAWTR